MYLFDTPSLERALALPLDPQLRRLLHQRVDHIDAIDFEVSDTTYFLVVEAGATIDDITEELGWSPLINPLDGRRFGSVNFRPFHDYLADHGAWFELLVSGGNDSMFVLLIEDADGTDSDLLALCRAHAT